MNAYGTSSAGIHRQPVYHPARDMYTSTSSTWDAAPLDQYQQPRHPPAPTQSSREDCRSRVNARSRRLNPEQISLVQQLHNRQRQLAIQQMLASPALDSPSSSPESQPEEMPTSPTSPTYPSRSKTCITDHQPNHAQPSPTYTSQRKAQYICLYPLCAGRAFNRHADLQRHDTRIHLPNPEVYDCPVKDCNRVGPNGLPRRDKLRDHLHHTHGVPRGEKAGGIRASC